MQRPISDKSLAERLDVFHLEQQLKLRHAVHDFCIPVFRKLVSDVAVTLRKTDHDMEEPFGDLLTAQRLSKPRELAYRQRP